MKLSKTELAKLDRLQTRTLYVGMHVAYSTARSLARKGLAVHNAMPCQYDAGAVHTLRITDAGRAELARKDTK